jgi:dihydrofolate reductase
MTRIVVSEFISLDGVIEDPGGAEGFEHGGWTFKFDQGEDGMRLKFEEVMEADALLLGRTTYEDFAKAWPTMEGTGEFGERMNGMPKHVLTSSPLTPEWANAHVLEGDLPAAVAGLEGTLLVNGSARLVQALTAHDLIDEYRLMVFPIVLGTGKRLFGESAAPASLRLVGTHPVGEDGVLMLTYAPRR